MDITEKISIIKENTAEIIPEHELTAKLEHARLKDEPLTVKLGVDPTAPDLHLGHMVVLRKLRDFQRLGHKIVLLIGDFTARIGDPSERSKTRPALTGEQIDDNAATYANQAFKLLDPKNTTIEYNSAWLSKLGFEDVVKLCSSFTVARILERDDFSKRYKEQKPIALHEFLYPVMQAYDSVALGADVEIGGTDQKFNLLAGRQLQESRGLAPQVCVTMPILVGTDGIKRMSKSTGNYIGITEEPRHMFGKTMSIPDQAMESWFKLATELPAAETARIISDIASGNLHPVKAKRMLARQIVTLYYDEEAAEKAETEFDHIFKQEGTPEQIPAVDLTLTEEEKTNGYIWIVRLLSESGLVLSNRDARNLVASGAVKINGERVLSDQQDVVIAHDLIVQVGKKKFAKVNFTNT